MKKFLSVLLICIALVSMVAGCGGSASPGATATVKPTPTPTPTPNKSIPLVPSPSKLFIRETTDGWRYCLEQGKMTLYGYNGEETSVTIPTTIVDEQGREQSVEVLDMLALCKETRIIIDDSKYQCDLVEVVIPDTIAEVPLGLFEMCDELTSITWKGFKIVNNVVFSSDMSILYYCLNKDITSYTIPSSVKTIAGGAFRRCEKLTKIDIPATVEKVGNYAFYGCASLTSVNVANGVKSLGIHAFTLCNDLESIIIPESVSSIGYRMFTFTSKLKIYIKEGSPVDVEFKVIAEDDVIGEQTTYLNYVVYMD